MDGYDEIEDMVQWLGRPRFDGTMIKPKSAPQAVPRGLRITGDVGRIKWIPS